MAKRPPLPSPEDRHRILHAPWPVVTVIERHCWAGRLIPDPAPSDADLTYLDNHGNVRYSQNDEALLVEDGQEEDDDHAQD